MFEKIASITVAVKDLASSSFKTISKNAEDLKDKASDLGSSWGKNIEDKFQSSITILGNISKYILGAGTALTAFGAITLKASSDNEQFTVALTNMLKSAEDADVLIGRLKSFAVVTPFELNTLKDMTKTLIAYGFGAGEVIPTLQKLGDIAAGVGTEKLPTIVEAFGKIRTKGKADMEQLNRILEAGVPILEEIAKNTNKSTTEVYKFVELGKVGFSDVAKAMETLSTGSGIFAGGMEKQSKTLGGIFSNIKDIIGQTFVGIGDVFLEDFKGIGNAIQKTFTGENLKSIKTWFIIVRKVFVDIKNDVLDFSDSFKIAGLEINSNWTRTITNMRVTLYDKFFGVMPEFIKKYFGEAIKNVNNETKKSVDHYNDNSKEIDAINQASIDRRERAEKVFTNQILKNNKLITNDVENHELKKRDIINVTTEKSNKNLLEKIKNSKKANEDILSDIIDFTIEEEKLNEDSAEENKKTIDGIVQYKKDKLSESGSMLASMFGVDDEGKAEIAINKLAELMKNNLTASFDQLDPSGFLGGFGGTLVEMAIKSFMGGNANYKSITDMAEDKFNELVKNTNKAIENIGREKTLVEKQIDTLKTIKGTGKTEITASTAESIGLKSVGNIDAIIKGLLEKTIELNNSAIEEKNRAVLEADKQIQDLKSQLQKTIKEEARNMEIVKSNMWGFQWAGEEEKSKARIQKVVDKISELEEKRSELSFEATKNSIESVKSNVELTDTLNKEYMGKQTEQTKIITQSNTNQQLNIIDNNNIIKTLGKTNELLSTIASQSNTISIDGKSVSQATGKYNPATQKLIDKGVA